MWFAKHSKQTRLLHRWQPIRQKVVFLRFKHRLHRPFENGMGQCPPSNWPELAVLPLLQKSPIKSFASSTRNASCVLVK